MGRTTSRVGISYAVRLGILAATAVVRAAAADEAGGAQAPGSTATGDDGLQLTWEAPASCPAAAEVVQSVEALIGARAATGPGQGFAAAAVVSSAPREASSWRVALTLTHQGNRARRSIQAASCRELADAVALVVAMAIEDAGDAEVHATAATPDKVRPFDAEDVSMAFRSDDAPSATSPSKRHVDLGVSLASEVGALPPSALGASLDTALSFTRERIRLEASFTAFPSSTEAPTATRPAATFSLLEGAIRGCFDAVTAPLLLAPCAGLAAGALRGVGEGAVRASAVTPWLAASAGVLLGWSPHALAPFGLTLRAEAGLPFLRTDFDIDEVTVHRAAAVTGRFSAGAQVRFF